MQVFKVIDKVKAHWQLVSCILVVLSLVVIFFIRQVSGKEATSLVNSSKFAVSSKEQGVAKSAQAETKDTSKVTMITVDLKGAVKNPAIYTLPKDSRVNDVIKLSGGLIDQADTKSINLAQKLTDEMVVYVASIGEVTTSNVVVAGEDSRKSSTSDATDKININTADLTQLQKLSGVGLKKAQDIINYREQNGDFKNIEDLVNVSGIGEKSIEKLKESIRVD